MKFIDFEDYSIDIDKTNAKDLISFIVKMEQNYTSNKDKLRKNMNQMKSNLSLDF